MLADLALTRMIWMTFVVTHTHAFFNALAAGERTYMLEAAGLAMSLSFAYVVEATIRERDATWLKALAEVWAPWVLSVFGVDTLAFMFK